jgi:hypothetical protein
MFAGVLDHNPSAQLSVALFGCRAAVLRLVHHGDEVVVEHGVGLHGLGGVAVEEDSAEMAPRPWAQVRDTGVDSQLKVH